MNASGHQPIWIYILIVALIAWRLYSRFRRSVGRQRLSKVRPWLTVTLFPIIVALFAVASFGNPLPLLSLLGGTAIGVGLGIYGHRVTKFEVTPTGLYYTPSAHLGIGLSVLMVARIGYRALQGQLLPAPGAQPQPANAPTTLLIFGALAGYYTAYAVGLLIWRHRVAGAPPEPAPADDGVER